ncbi:MAG: hypothetical protein DRR16_26875 [Candidatus Parabeggiatoa sp. nov. 3]|nr:MAG: hypothetical protein DRR00_27025 [Gammaproteobacteria bacterium]RKZ59218.1 MAG: hypothetical protein DRQ99_24080 [Gammaproteobacteria bacterium]RKZ78854.1 MAG: hypothetical protein DRR16_26875 [Gammaproteobacteria bacterium]HEW97072.1 hypothetical protein [Beggiatoa sp.]
MWNDPIVEEIRRNSAKIAAQFNYDVRAFGHYYLERQKQDNKPVVSLPPRLAGTPQRTAHFRDN